MQVAEEQEEQLSKLKADMADRLAAHKQRLEDEQAALIQAQAQVSHNCWLQQQFASLLQPQSALTEGQLKGHETKIYQVA